MGIKGIYKEIGPGKRISLCKLAVDQLEKSGRPLRLAIDISIWQFQVQAAKGGANPAIRTLFYRLVRLLGLSIQPLFVFDGPNKPAFKRNKRSTGRPGDTVATAMAKRLIRLFGFAVHDAPGEAEAECALLQRAGVVDAVLSEDVDTIMFGCSRTLRNWTAEGAKGSKTPTHVSVYDAADLRLGDGEALLDREGMVLVALMSGGDYLPAGVPGCGVKVACEAARAGFGRSLCRIKRSDKTALVEWREKLLHELRTNESGYFRTRHKALEIPEDFPNLETLRYYTHPVVSQDATVDRLRKELPSSHQVDVAGLRDFVRETFDWTHRIGAVKYIRVLAPSLLVQALLGAPKAWSNAAQDDAESRQKSESALVKAISSRRSHFSTDATPELRISYTPADIVGLDLDAEPEEAVSSFGRNGLALNSDDEFDELNEELGAEQASAGKKAFDPLQPDLVWIPESVAKLGVPLAVHDWEEKQRSKQLKAAAKPTRKGRSKQTGSAMPEGALDKWVSVIKGVKTTEKVAEITILSSHVDPASSSLANPPLSQDLRMPRMSLRSVTKESTAPVRSKPSPPKKPSRSSKITVPKPTGQTNPWTLAGSQVSPRVTKPTAAGGGKNLFSSQQSPQFSCAEQPIVISSSPPAHASPSPLRAVLSLAKPSPSSDAERLASSSVEDQLETDPFGLSSQREHGASPRQQLSPRSTIVGSLPLRLATDRPSSASSGSPKRTARPCKLTKSGAGEDVASSTTVATQRSIVDYVGAVRRAETSSEGRVDTRPLVHAQDAQPVETIEISDDEERDDDGTPCELSSTSQSRSGSDQGDQLSPLSDTDSAAQSLPEFQPENDRQEGDRFNLTGEADVDVASPLHTTTTPGCEAQDETAAPPPAEQSAFGNGDAKTTTKLYIPRKSGIGYYREVEVTRDEADLVAAGISTHPAVRGARGPIWRRSDISVVDLTEFD